MGEFDSIFGKGLGAMVAELEPLVRCDHFLDRAKKKCKNQDCEHYVWHKPIRFSLKENCRNTATVCSLIDKFIICKEAK